LAAWDGSPRPCSPGCRRATDKFSPSHRLPGIFQKEEAPPSLVFLSRLRRSLRQPRDAAGFVFRAGQMSYKPLQRRKEWHRAVH